MFHIAPTVQGLRGCYLCNWFLLYVSYHKTNIANIANFLNFCFPSVSKGSIVIESVDRFSTFTFYRRFMPPTVRRNRSLVFVCLSVRLSAICPDFFLNTRGFFPLLEMTGNISSLMFLFVTKLFQINHS